MKVRVGRRYKYIPCFFDKIFACSGNILQENEIVQVVNLPGCPPANTMNQCYVKRAGSNEQFCCMVSTASLEKEY